MFSMDYDQNCEDFTLYDENDNELTELVSYEEVAKFIVSLLVKVPDFYLSEHRTSGIVIFDNDVMSIRYQSFNSPDWNDFEKVVIKDIPIIPFEIDEE